MLGIYISSLLLCFSLGLYGNLVLIANACCKQLAYHHGMITNLLNFMKHQSTLVTTNDHISSILYVSRFVVTRPNPGIRHQSVIAGSTGWASAPDGNEDTRAEAGMVGAEVGLLRHVLHLHLQ